MPKRFSRIFNETVSHYFVLIGDEPEQLQLPVHRFCPIPDAGQIPRAHACLSPSALLYGTCFTSSSTCFPSFSTCLALATLLWGCSGNSSFRFKALPAAPNCRRLDLWRSASVRRLSSFAFASFPVLITAKQLLALSWRPGPLIHPDDLRDLVHAGTQPDTCGSVESPVERALARRDSRAVMGELS